jgi:hypothetical protein
MYANGKMIPIENIPGMGGVRRIAEVVNSSVIYSKNFCKCPNYLHPAQQLKRIYSNFP